MTIEVLICSFNKGIVKVEDVLLPPRENVHYIISYQFTDERYLEMLPASILERKDVTLYKYKGQGLSSNRNQALSHATADILLYADDDTRLLPTTFDTIAATFSAHPEVDVAFFCAATYTGRPLKDYPATELDVTGVPTDYHVSTIEIAFRRERVQGTIRFDERFGLGTKFLTCGEEDIWIYDSLKHNLTLRFFPLTTVQTSTMMKQRMIYIDAGVQRSYGAYLYYVHGHAAWFHCFSFALRSTLKGYCHFLPMLLHLVEGARYMLKKR